MKENVDVAIIGGGISGMSCAYHLKEAGVPSVVLEKDDTYGGLCGNFEVAGFRFDRFVHFTFADNPYTREILECGNEMIRHKPESSNYSNGHWLRHPIQNNLLPLPVEEKIKIIKSFISRPSNNVDLKNYEEWLRVQYGDYFSENYPMKYTEKYWTVPAHRLGTKWVGDRMHRPSLEEVLRGSMELHEDISYYTKEMRYPKYGGYKSVLNKIKKDIDIIYNKEIIRIDAANKILHFSDGSKMNYNRLVSSLPLNKVVHLMDGTPNDVLNAASKLLCTGGYLVYFGFNRADVPKHLWFYIYDKDILPSRVYSPSLKSSDNAPVGKSSMLAEVYFSSEFSHDLLADEILDQVKSKLIKMGVFSEQDVEVCGVRQENYANVVFTHETYWARNFVRSYVTDNCGIELIGRFGEWEYYWSNQSFESGMRVAHKIANEFKD